MSTHSSDPIREIADPRIADLVPVGGSVVVMTASAIQAHIEAVAMMGAAAEWATGTGLTFEDAEGMERANREVKQRRNQVRLMQDSYWRCMARLMTVPQEHDGHVIVSRDGEASFYWRHVRSGYHGGIVLHAMYRDGERLPVGTWSTHT